MNTTTKTVSSVCPHTKQVLGEFACADQAAVGQAVSTAARTFQKQQLDLNSRLQLISNLRTLIADNADEIAQLISTEVGKPLSECFSAEIAGVLDTCVWLKKHAPRLLASQRVRLGNPLAWRKRCSLHHEPLGVIGIISPWNFPFSIPMTSVLQAVAAGNTVVLKPSEKSTMVGLKIAELFQQAGFPEGTVNVVVGDGLTGKCLSEHPKLSRLILTGSVRAGQRIVEQTARNLTPVTLELGGKDAAIVLPDAPVEYTSRGLVWGAFTNAGQACASVERVYIVDGPNTQDLIYAIVEKTLALRVGAPATLAGLRTEKPHDVGPIIDETQLMKISAQVEDARKNGATIHCGGRILAEMPGYFYEPTVITGVNHEMAVMREETFGPVVAIMVVPSVEEAVRLANDSNFGLTASIWSASVRDAQAIAPQLQVGTVYVNDCIFSHAAPELPWGGVKHSGIGRSHSHIGLMDMVNIKNINLDTARGAGRLWWYPYSGAHAKLFQGGIQAMHGSSIRARLRGAIKMVTNFFFK